MSRVVMIVFDIGESDPSNLSRTGVNVPTLVRRCEKVTRLISFILNGQGVT